MPFDPELQARIEAARSTLQPKGGDPLSMLRAKLDARKGKPGFADNATEIEARISEMSGGSQESDND